MKLTEEHYQQLLGLHKPWSVYSVRLFMERKRVDIYIKHTEKQACCPQCKKPCPVYDHAPERAWPHLDTMQFITQVHCASPRVKCSDHGVQTLTPPWTQKHSHFTLLFETFAIAVLEAARSVQDATRLLRINWHQAERIKERAVERGLQRRKAEEIPWVGMDEKQFMRGQSYVSILCDLEHPRVLEVVPDRDEKASVSLINKGLNEKQREMVCGASVDMWDPFCAAIKKKLPHADIVHDRFHISKHLNEAVDQVRRREHKKLRAQQDDRLKGTKYSWLKKYDTLEGETKEAFDQLVASELEVSKAWGLKELFNHFWSTQRPEKAFVFFTQWHEEVVSSGLKPLQKVARMIKKKWENIVSYFSSYLTNAVCEGLNSKIQLLKSNARGYRSFESYRRNILFYCGGLELYP